MMTSSTYDIQLTTFTYGGDVLGRLPDGRAVFVPFAIPGEHVRIRVAEERRGFVRGELVEVLESSPQRVQPRCVHFGVCGGCHYQHIDYARQLSAKQAILRDQLERIGGISNPPVGEIVPSPQEWYYRNHVQFHLTPEGKLGYQASGSHTVIAIRECHLPEPALNAIWPQLDFERIPGLERVGLRQGDDEEAMLVFESDDPQPPEFYVDFPISAVHLSPQGEIVLAGEDALTMTILGRDFRVSAPSFFQVNTRQAENMVRHLMERLPLTPGSTVFDVYCGVGLFSAFLAPLSGQVVGIELGETACSDYAANLDEFDNVSLYQGPAEVILPDLNVNPEVVVVDPPRAGLERRALDALVSHQARTLAYVSCDPSTLARDAKRLIAAGYHLDESTPFDLFPQTFHIETISIFTR
jgi:23S rRNA (uracil1939-C5)-methyltransferase